MIFNRYARGGGGGGLGAFIYVTVEAGSVVTATMGTMTRNAVYSQGVYVIDVPAFGDWVVTATKDGKTASATVTVDKAGMYEVTLRYISATLNDNDWVTIKEVADVSEGANYWSVGDTKQITINGKLSDGLTLSNYSTYVYIIGFDHNSEREGTGIAFQGFKTAQSGGTDVCLCDSGYNSSKTSGQWFNMNNSSTNTGGWASSRMRSTTLPVVKSALPTELTSVIKTTTLYSDNTGGGSDVASYVTTTQDDLYLLAEFEIFGAKSYANTAEQNYQKQYAYYVAGNSKVKYKHNDTATAAYWWERSVYAADAANFCYVNTDGAANNGDARRSRGLALAFRVGGAVTEPVSKGDIIYMNLGNAEPPAGTNNKYRVLDIDGSVAKVLAMYEVNTNTAYGPSGGYGTSYVNRILAGFYNTLSSLAQEAIVQGNVSQYSYNINSASFNASTHASYADFSTRMYAEPVTTKIFALDVYDVELYFGGNSDGKQGIFSKEDLWEMFYDVRTKPDTNTYPWLRSNVLNSSDAWYVSDSSGFIYNYGVTETGFSARPAFYIDLDKISWSFNQ